jgi:hypothetical protein
MSPPDDQTDVAFLRAMERAEAAWLLAREIDPDAPAPSAEIAADYAELEDLLGSLSSRWSDDSWQEDVLRAVSALSPRPWWRTVVARWLAAGALATAAAAVVWMLLPRAPTLEVAVRHTRITRGASDELVVGDQLLVTARPREIGDLRVYRRSDGTLVARCPRGPGCMAESAGAQTIEITLDAPGQYQVILVDGLGDALPDGAMDAYLEAANAMNARVTGRDPIVVH